MMRGERARMAADIFASRRDRDAAFVGLEGGFGEPAWDMLLVLYITDAVGRCATRQELLVAANVEHAIAEPYIGWLISQGLAGFGEEDGTIRLLDAGRVMMDAYLDLRGMRGRDKKFIH
ncbi:hypothetical protein [uncultured Sphingomonas sp.]|uniref:hypothetical protein n=1 Tax=uncultured Sphingomonas sp. TaxID=158754 RepID=UPI00374999F7